MNIKSPSLITIKQLPFWNSLLDEKIDYLEEGYDYPVFGVETVKSLLEKIDYFYSDKTVWLIQHGANVAGIFAIGNFPESIEGKNHWYETVIYVHPDYRNLDIAKTLTLSAARSFEHKPYGSLVVEVRTDNIGSINAHTKIFPTIKPVLVNHTDFDAYQWRVEDSKNVETPNKWLSQEIGLGTAKFFKHENSQ